MIGTKLAHYEIRAHLGSGGMGDVYRASDTKLNREVAIKVLPDIFAHDARRMARFEREAKVLASLNHPNIAHIYGVEERALVMELAEGESPKGPMPFDEAWKIAVQIADALEYAHEQGVVHRDLKPANIKVTPDGVVKLLDFGLAKAFSDTSDSAGNDPSNSPTLTLGGTVVGTIMGTAAYMAPEQARGKRVDKRADIWSWGVVLYELLTGERMFQGEDAAETLAAVIYKQPELERVPPQVRRLLDECLQKDPKLRLRDIGDARRFLEETAPTAPLRSGLGAAFGWAVAAVLLVISAVSGFVAWKHLREDPPRVVKLSFPLPEGQTFAPGRSAVPAVSPDGRRIAFQAVVDGKAAIWVRDLDNPVLRMLTSNDTSGAPFWAPDSRRLGFFSEGKLKKIDVTGGPAVIVADIGVGLAAPSGSWNQEDIIIFGGYGSPLFRVPASSGSLAPLTDLDKSRSETTHISPWFLPDGRHFLYLALSNDPQKRAIYVGSLESKTRKQVIAGNPTTIYVALGYLLFAQDRMLMAQPFDTGKLETTGDARPVVEEVDVVNAGMGAAVGNFSASQNGVLAYTSGRISSGNLELTWFDRTGKKLDSASAPGVLGPGFSLSPDGASVAFARRDSQRGWFDVWTRDLARGSESRLTFTGQNVSPVWSADGTQIYFTTSDVLQSGKIKIYRKNANNTGPEEEAEDAARFPADASRDGRYLLTVSRSNPKTGSDIWVLPLFGDRKPFPYVQTEFNEVDPKLSADGRWLAYASDESKRSEIYVVSFPKLGGKWHVSTNGGQYPVWSRDGRELYYYGLDGKMMAVGIKPGAEFQFGVAKPLFEIRTPRTSSGFDVFDVSKDGRFLLAALVEQKASTPMTVVLNWPEMLKKK
jgi:Tol biopolymer transport system component